jgi:MbtH protein
MLTHDKLLYNAFSVSSGSSIGLNAEIWSVLACYSMENTMFDDETALFVVVINIEEQYSIWPEFKPVPAGWRPAGKSGTKTECLDYIREVWTDMRPKSLRQHLAHVACSEDNTKFS